MEYICQYCNSIRKNLNSLKQHECRCSKNPNRRDYDKVGIYSHTNFKGQTKFTNDSIAKVADKLIGHIGYMKGKPGTFLGKHHIYESKQKCSLSMKKFLNDNNIKGRFRYSIKACNYIDYINKINNWNLVHALNGGEFHIDSYSVDGYDKDLNIVFEYGEKRHYKDVRLNELKDKDKERQKYIINKLHCRFFRYNEYLNLLYEVKLKE